MVKIDKIKKYNWSKGIIKLIWIFGKNEMKIICRKYIGFITAVVLIEIVMVSVVWAIPQKVYFAGFAFLSDYSDIGQEYPFSKNVLGIDRDTTDFKKIDEILRKKIEKISNPNINFVINELADYQSANALSNGTMEASG